MNVYMLYKNREWKGAKTYYDSSSIIHDLGLENLFRAASRDQERSEENVQTITDADEHLANTLKRVMTAPLFAQEEISYRQEILKDCIENPEFIKDLYGQVCDMMISWEKLGKKEMNKPGARGKHIHLTAEVKILHLFVNVLSELKTLCRRSSSQLRSEGLQRFCSGLEAAFSDQWEAKIREVLEDLTFFNDGTEGYGLNSGSTGLVRQAKIVLECRLGDGMKLGDMRMDSVETINKKYRRTKEKKTMMEKITATFASEPTTILKDPMLLEDLARLEGQVVGYILQRFRPFMAECGEFFEELYIQSAFYRACYNLYVRSQNMELELCYPTVCAGDCMSFENLTEFSMALFRSSVPVGNTCSIKDKMLLIVTGANQGGKSTFLRSIGIAQVMLQCGMFVSARRFESGIFPFFFTHFTRREDIAMNSGRLDEELKRIDQIVRHLGKNAMVLLNESFATTTEEEGSVIAYDVIRALVEAGVKVLTVTHLLSFAKKVYAEGRPEVSFLSAERKENGLRTYKMIPNEPELTSFGLDLYERMIPDSASV